MISQENASGKPLAAIDWLEKHHNAKIPERTAFAKRISNMSPKKIVDLGCASGLWLDLLDKTISPECEFIGIDTDQDSLDVAKNKSNTWNRKASFLNLNIEEEADRIPAADVTTAFNIFPYIKDIDRFMKILSNRTPRGILVIRQYDGASIRFGPMDTSSRQKIENSLRVATENSQQFRHYDMDRTFEAINKSQYEYIDCSFELFERTSPFSNDFIPYYEEMLNWTIEHISEDSSDYLRSWLKKDSAYTIPRYFYEVDLVSIVS